MILYKILYLHLELACFIFCLIICKAPITKEQNKMNLWSTHNPHSLAWGGATISPNTRAGGRLEECPGLPISPLHLNAASHQLSGRQWLLSGLVQFVGYRLSALLQHASMPWSHTWARGIPTSILDSKLSFVAWKLLYCKMFTCNSWKYCST